MAKYTFYTVGDVIADVVKVAANTAALPTHTVVTIDPSTFAVTVKATAPAIGDFLIWRPYPKYDIAGDRYGRIPSIPIATSTGELYGFKIKAGDKLVVEDAAGISGLTNGQVLEF